MRVSAVSKTFHIFRPKPLRSPVRVCNKCHSDQNLFDPLYMFCVIKYSSSPMKFCTSSDQNLFDPRYALCHITSVLSPFIPSLKQATFHPCVYRIPAPPRRPYFCRPSQLTEHHVFGTDYGSSFPCCSRKCANLAT